MKKRKKYLQYRARQRKWSKYGSWLKSECTLCGEKGLFYYDQYDAVCCIFCNCWIDGVCGDPKCSYCATRPSKPSEALELEDRQDSMVLKKDWLRKNYQRRMRGKLRRIRRFNKKDK